LHLPANARLGINGKVHYPAVSPENYVPPFIINNLFYFYFIDIVVGVLLEDEAAA
jgi:hypothetical protein